jgi:hypothetical protein
MNINEATPEEWDHAYKRRYYQMDISNMLTQDFQVTVVREFCNLHIGIAEDAEVIKACVVLMEYCKPVEGREP